MRPGRPASSPERSYEFASPDPLAHLDGSLRKALVQSALFGRPLPTLEGRYELDRRLGAGGNGVVYAARDRELDRPVALKFLRVQADPASRRLRREARLLAAVQHPNVVSVFGLSRHDAHDVLVMELVDGDDLGTVMRDGQVTRAAACELVIAAAQGLAHAHASGVVHGDFKPDNIVVDARGTAKLADFGLARAEHDPAATGTDQTRPSADGSGASTHFGSRGGMTPAYAAPERLRGAPPNMASDQYSVAVTLHEVIVGARPRAGRASDALPRRARAALRRGLAAAPDERWPDVVALLAAVRGPRGPRGSRVGIGLAVSLASLGAALLVSWPSTVVNPRPASDGDFDSLIASPASSERDAIRYDLDRLHRALREGTEEAIERDAAALRERARRGGHDDLHAEATFISAIQRYRSGADPESVLEWTRAAHAQAVSAEANWVAAQSALLTASVLQRRQGRAEPALDWVGTARAYLVRADARPGERAQADLVHGSLLLDLGRYADAREALSLATEQFDAEDPPWRLDRKGPLLLLASLAVTADEAQAASDLYDEAATIIIEEQGEHHVNFGAALRSRAAAALARGDFDDALSYSRRALAFAEERHRPTEHPWLFAQIDHAGNLAAAGAFDEAEAHYRRAYDHLPEHDDDDSRNTIALGRAAAALAAGDLEAAHEGYARARVAYETSDGPDHPDLAYVFLGLGEVALRREQFEDAAAYLQRALAMRTLAFGEGSVGALRPRVALARLDLARGRLDAAANRLSDVEPLLAERGDTIAADLAGEAWLALARTASGQDAPAAEVAAFAQRAADAFARGGPTVADRLALARKLARP